MSAIFSFESHDHRFVWETSFAEVMGFFFFISKNSPASSWRFKHKNLISSTQQTASVLETYFCSWNVFRMATLCWMNWHYLEVNSYSSFVATWFFMKFHETSVRFSTVFKNRSFFPASRHVFLKNPFTVQMISDVAMLLDQSEGHYRFVKVLTSNLPIIVRVVPLEELENKTNAVIFKLCNFFVSCYFWFFWIQ